MKIILLKDVKKLGKKYDVKDVADGYFQNCLLPHGFAIPASKQNLVKLTASQSKIDELRKAERSRLEAVLARLKAREIVILAKTSSKGTLFSSVKAEAIAQAASSLAATDISPDAFQIVHPFDKVGTYSVKIELDKDVKGEVKILVKSANEG